jgi:hypothetical protein
MALQDTALRLIKKFGEDRIVTLRVPVEAPADPAKPWEVDPGDTVVDTPVPGVVVPIARSLVDGNSVQQGDETVLIAGISLGTTVPTVADQIVDEGTAKNIMDVIRVRPGKTDFLYKLQVRAP